MAPADVERDPGVHRAEWARASADLPRILRVDTEVASEPVCSLGQGGRLVVSSPRLSPIHALVSTFSKKERREGGT